MLENELNYLKAAKLIKNARSIVLLAGAGMSADSGSPIYEDPKTLVNDFPELAVEGITSYNEIAKAKWFTLKPKIAWLFANSTKNNYLQSEPHAGYNILKAWLDTKHTSFTVTTNVDGAFIRSGFEEVLEIHGNHFQLQCTNNCHNETWSIDSKMSNTDAMPTCPHCGVIARPNILYFEDPNFCTENYEQQTDQYRKFMTHASFRKPIAIEIGAGTLLPMLRHESLKFDHVIRINPNPDDDFSNENTIHIQETALNALRRLDQLI